MPTVRSPRTHHTHRRWIPVASLGMACTLTGCTDSFSADELNVFAYHACDLLDAEAAEQVDLPVIPMSTSEDETSTSCVWHPPDHSTYASIAVVYDVGYDGLSALADARDEEIDAEAVSGYPALTSGATDTITVAVSPDAGLISVIAPRTEPRMTIAEGAIRVLSSTAGSGGPSGDPSYSPPESIAPPEAPEAPEPPQPTFPEF